jgi:hypothetical protein
MRREAVVKPKTIAGIVLLVFAGASVVVLIVKEASKPGQPGERGTEAAVSAPDSQGPGATGETADRKVLVYYFHGSARCRTCRSIEAYAREAVETGFAEALRDGALAWRIVNIEEPGNEHFVQDFQLASRSVVVAELEGDRTIRWKNLPLIWELVGDKAEFLEYVQGEVRDYAGGD